MEVTISKIQTTWALSLIDLFVSLQNMFQCIIHTFKVTFSLLPSCSVSVTPVHLGVSWSFATIYSELISHAAHKAIEMYSLSGIAHFCADLLSSISQDISLISE